MSSAVVTTASASQSFCSSRQTWRSVRPSSSATSRQAAGNVTAISFDRPAAR